MANFVKPENYSVQGGSHTEALSLFRLQTGGEVPKGFTIQVKEIGHDLYEASFVRIPRGNPSQE